MKLVHKRWLSWTIRAILYLPLIALVVSLLSVPARNRRFARISKAEVENRYRELVKAGKLETPAEGFDAVTFGSRHGGPPFAIWFHRGNRERGQFRYFAYRQLTPDGNTVWLYKDTRTNEIIR